MDHTSSPEEPFDALQRRLQLERRRTADELAAFETFVKRVEDVPTNRVAPTFGPSVLTNQSPAGGLESVRKAYCSTIMDVAHYDEEYGNEYAEDVIEEFGSTAAAALLENGSLTAQTKRLILEAAADSRASRTALLDLIGAEIESVRVAATHLRPIGDELATIVDVAFQNESFGALDGYRARMDVLADQVVSAAERRQTDLHDHRTRTAFSGNVVDLPCYLYQGFEPTFPILSFIASLGDQINAIQQDIAQAVSRYETEYDPSFSCGVDTRRRTES
jgi:hypothetical protein